MANFSENFLATFVPGFQSGLQRAETKKTLRSQAELEAQQLQERERQSLVRTLLGSDSVSASAKNQLLASILPQLNQTRQVEERVSAPINQPAIAVGRQAEAVAPSNLPTMQELPDKSRLPYTNMMTPVGLATALRGGTGQSLVSPATGYNQTKTVTEPTAVFQDKPVAAEKKPVDPVLTEAGQTIFKLYQEGKVPESAVREFLPSYQEAVRTGDFSKLKLPTALTESTALSEKERAELARIKQQTATGLTQQKLDEARMGQIGTEKPLTSAQKVSQTRGLANDIERSKPVQQFKTIRLQAYKTNKILDDVSNKLARGVKQEVALVAFQKALDEISAAREGEVARTIGMQGFLDQVIAGVRGAISGGKLTDETVNSLRDAMNIFGATAQRFANDEVTKGRDRGASFGLDADQIAKLYKDFPETLESGAPSATTSAAPTTGPNRYRGWIQQNLK